MFRRQIFLETTEKVSLLAYAFFSIMANALQDVEANIVAPQNLTSKQPEAHKLKPNDDQTMPSKLKSILELPRSVSLSPGNIDPYISDVDERWELVGEYCRIQEKCFKFCTLGSHDIAVFMLAPLSRLRSVVKRATSRWSANGLDSMVLVVLYDMRACK